MATDERKLDQIVKGAPPPNTSLPSLAAKAVDNHTTITGTNTSSRSTTPGNGGNTPQPADPTQFLPSSPPQIYLNLLILEASLRQQYLTLRSRRRQHSFVVFFLCLWLFWFTYAQFLRPREDGTGVGGSVYWIIDMTEKVALIGGWVMGALFKVTGQWERGVKWPRRWLHITNRGLRSINLKIVVLEGPWWWEMVSHLSFLLPLQVFFPTPGSSYHYIDYTPIEKKAMLAQGRQRYGAAEGSKLDFAEEDVAPGGDHIKILLLPKQFTPDFRENWEVYRDEYWAAENTRRAELRKRIRAKEREVAKQQGGWLWWTGWRGWPRLWFSTSSSNRHEIYTPAHHVHSSNHSQAINARNKRRPSVIKDRDGGSHSRSSSRSSTAAPDGEDNSERRWSTASTGSVNEKRRRSKIIGSTTELERSGSVTGRTRPGSVRLTPAREGSGTGASGFPPAELKTRNSNLSSKSTGSDSSEGKSARAMATPPSTDPAVKTEPED
ncbi:hypothetical protein EJ08DRAFT_645723 [Tothia fuscella]|uniref:Spo7-like protein n=1 Tax=Tothia fuscella TaxID=1048955 RepID=A0A9P4NZL9_9PEZI|nr:hypothetical protein EJ08DRAFT_645723 [Tothia fuscella]